LPVLKTLVVDGPSFYNVFHSITLDTLEVEDLHDAKITDEFIDHIHPNEGVNITVTRCGLVDLPFYANCLTLNEISEGKDILPILLDWVGTLFLSTVVLTSTIGF
jgi:hypothetical protein